MQRFYHFLDLKTKNPDAAIPPLDEALKRITEPDAELLSKNKSVIDEFRRCFEVKENFKVESWLILVLNLLLFLQALTYFLLTEEEIC